MRDLPEYPWELGGMGRNGVGSTEVGKFCSGSYSLIASRQEKTFIWRHAHAINITEAIQMASTLLVLPLCIAPKEASLEEVLIPQLIFPYLPKSKRFWPSPPSPISEQHKYT